MGANTHIMEQSNRFIYDMLDFDLPDAVNDVFWLAGKPTKVREENGAVILEIPFQALNRPKLTADNTKKRKTYLMTIQAYGDDIVRCSLSFGSALPDDESNEMIEWDPSLKRKDLYVEKTELGWDICDCDGVLRMRINSKEKPIKNGAHC